MKIQPGHVSESNRCLEEMYFPLNRSSTKFIRAGYNMFNGFEVSFHLWDRVTNIHIALDYHDLFRMNLFVNGSYTESSKSGKMQLSSSEMTDYLKGDVRIIRLRNFVGDTSLSCTEATIKNLIKLNILYQYNRVNNDLQIIVEDIFHFLRSDKCIAFESLEDLSKNFAYIVDGVGTEKQKIVSELFYKFPETTVSIMNKN
jgi:hypothetical protein